MTFALGKHKGCKKLVVLNNIGDGNTQGHEVSIIQYTSEWKFLKFEV
jgi:hypothetical protein